MNKQGKNDFSSGARHSSWLSASIIGALSLTAMNLQAQEAVSAAGATATGNGGSVSYTVGQVAYVAASSATGSIQEGVQQSYTISVISALPNSEHINLQCSAYPNPTSDVLKLSLENTENNSMTYTLYSADGKEFDKGTLSLGVTSINVREYPSGNYYLNISNAISVIKTFKIVKQK